MNCEVQPCDIEEQKDGWMDVRFILKLRVVFIFVNITWSHLSTHNAWWIVRNSHVILRKRRMDGWTFYVQRPPGIHLPHHNFIAAFNSQCIMVNWKYNKKLNWGTEGRMDGRFIFKDRGIHDFVSWSSMVWLDRIDNDDKVFKARKSHHHHL